MKLLHSFLLLLLCTSAAANKHVASIDAEVKRIDSLCRDFIHPLVKYKYPDSLYLRDFTDTINGVTRHWHNAGDCYHHSTYKKGNDVILCRIILANAEQLYYFENNHLIKYIYRSHKTDTCIDIAYGHHREMYFKGRRMILRKDIVPLPADRYPKKYVLRESRMIYRYSRNYDKNLESGIGS